MSSIIVLDSSDEDSSEKQETQEKRLRWDKNPKNSVATTTTTMSLLKTPLKPTQSTSATTITNIAKPAKTSTSLKTVISNTPQKILKNCPIPSGITITRFNPTVGVKVYPLTTTAPGLGTSVADNDTRKITTNSVQLKISSSFRKTLDQQLCSTVKQKDCNSLMEQPKLVHQRPLSPLHMLQKTQHLAEVAPANQLPAEPNASLANRKTQQNRTTQVVPQTLPKNSSFPQIKPTLSPLAQTNPPVIFHRVSNATLSNPVKPNQVNVECMKVQASSVKSVPLQSPKTPHLATLPNVHPPVAIPVTRAGVTISARHTITSTLPPKTSQQTEATLSDYSTMTTSVATPLTDDTLSSTTAPMTAVVPMLPIITSVQSMAPSATPPLKLLATPPHIASSLVESAEYLNLELMSPPRPSSATDSNKVQRPTETNTIPTKSLPLSPLHSSMQQIQQASPANNVENSKNTTTPMTPASKQSLSPVAPKRRRIQPTFLSPLLKGTDVANNNNETNNANPDVRLVSTTPLFSNSRSPVVNTPLTPTAISGDLPSMDLQTSKIGGRSDAEVELITTKINAQEQSDASIHSAEYQELLKVCREADTSDDMNKLIKVKLIKYYHNAHSDYLRSRSFRRSVLSTIELIKREPALVYLHLKPFVDELKVRRGTKGAAPDDETVEETPINCDSKTELDSNQSLDSSECVSSPATTSTGNKQTDRQIKKLNRTLHILKKHIDLLEQAEVDWDDEDSSYLRLERLKKRACLIYNKICDLTGESRNAHRLDKKPIKFNGTDYLQFNKTLQAYINRTKAFPDFCDVLRLFEHCNETCGYNLAPFQAKRIAQDAFIEVGKLLQARRKTDLYETVTHFTANAKDPAQTDPDLLAKLSDNRKKHTKISEVLDKYAREQDMNADELRLARLQKASYTENGSTAKSIDNDNPSAALKDTERDETENKDIAKNIEK